MTLQSMTGFSRVDGGDETCTWYWEVRSVNGKGLDIRSRLPGGFDALEPLIRKVCGSHLKRGNCSVNLFIQRESGGLGVQLNETVLGDLMAVVARASEITGLDRPSLDALLTVRGVLDVSEGQESDAVQASRRDAIMTDLDTAVSQLAKARGEEGARMTSILETLVDEVSVLVDDLEASPGRDLEAIRLRLQTKVERLLEDSAALDPQRLHQEVVLLATKADIEEELGRLRSHVTAARDLLAKNEPVGRQLDFLAQEFNREANTVCSKSSSDVTTQVGMKLKTVIDQFREQVQNVE